MEIELSRGVMDDDPAETYVSWYAEWGFEGSSVGTEDSNEDLTELVDDILDDLHDDAQRYHLYLKWTLDGDPPEGGTVADAVAQCNVDLPAELP